MHSERRIEILLLMIFVWAAASSLISCAPAKLTRADIDHLRIAAQKGDARSRVLIGEAYEFGADVPADKPAAARWYQLAADQDEPEAQYHLGVMYEQGIGVSRNTAESLKWLFHSAEAGYERSQIMLAALYLKERDLAQEFLKRIKKYRQSAQKGNPAAQYMLGWVYREGVGTPVNPREALAWYQKAAGQGNAKAEIALANIYLEGKLAPASPGDALLWYQKSAGTERPAQVKLIELYRGAGGIKENEEEAKKWSRRLAQNTDASLRSYLDLQQVILNTEKERNPARALRVCDRLQRAEPAGKETSDVCQRLQRQAGDKTEARFGQAWAALEKRDWDAFRNHFSDLLTADFEPIRVRRLNAAAWRLIEEETRSREKTAREILRQMEVADRVSYRRKNAPQIIKMINAFKAAVNQALRDNPGDEDLVTLVRRAGKVIASLQEKMKAPPPKEKKEEKAASDLADETPDDHDPGEDDYRKAQALFQGGRYSEAARYFEKTTKIRGSGHIASAYIYLGISHLARINPANINEARKLHLKGLAYFQNALRFDDAIALPAGFDKYQSVFEEAKGRLK
ncbi:MAG: hypothetical protein EG826_02795 [Deltaproteobacteria bacterium]|nr:hypothetical protein [Deltaproteobacteria bacterium]